MTVSAVIPLVVAVVAFIAATPFVRRQRKKASVDLEETTLALAQREIQIERDARLAQEARCTERIERAERRHSDELAQHREDNAAKLGELQGQVNVLTASFAETIATAVLHRMEESGAWTNGD